MFKNLSLRQISFYIVIALAIVNILVLYVMVGWSFILENKTKIGLLFVGASLASFLIIQSLLEKFVFRKIKIIYKFIHNSKLSKDVKKDFDIDGKSLDTVNAEVIEWAEDTQKELNSLKSLEEYRKDFVGNISHELKTPIFSIQGYLYTLLDGGLHDETINENYLKRAANNVERLQNIVEDLEAISRLESGTLNLDLQKFDIKSLVMEVFQDLKGMAEERNITLGLKDNADVSFSVMADRENIRQVLNNLIVNSIKYGKEDGTTLISFYDIDKNVLIEVSDDGLGIEEEHLKHLFDRFYRIDKSRSRTAGGSGLGLSIVKHIIEAHNQTINVRSAKDVGSTFGFTLKKA